MPNGSHPDWRRTEPLRRELRRACAEAGVERQPTLDIATTGRLSVKTRFDIHRMAPLPIALYESVDDEGRPTPSFVSWAREIARHLARVEAWRAELPAPDGLQAPPPWMRLAHPLMRLAHSLRPAALQGTTSTCADMIQGALTVVPGPVHVGLHRVDSLDRAMEVQMHVHLPAAALLGLAGRPLSTLVALPASGDPEIDGDVAALVVDRTRAMPPRGIGARLRPVAWKPLEPPPPGMPAPTWHLRHPLLV